MFVNGKRRIPLRCSVTHLAPRLYELLEAGDELVVYRTDAGFAQLDGAVGDAFQPLLQYLTGRRLGIEAFEINPCSRVWLLVKLDSSGKAI